MPDRQIEEPERQVSGFPPSQPTVHEPARGRDTSVMATTVETLGAQASCVSCAAQPGASRDLLFCSVRCRETAKAVRYARKALREGRADDPDVAYAIQQKTGFAATGGYDESRRRLPDAVRAAVIERDGGACRECGRRANQIDHIDWSVPEPNDPANLQLLCGDCHRTKTLSNTRAATVEEEAWIFHIRTRIASQDPMRPCDDEAAWEGIWRAVAKLRRAAAASSGSRA
jgi:5-methylcytosine-specific restriction endonuclease McrA